MAWLVEFDLYNDSQSKEKKMTKLHFTFALGVLLSAGAFAQEPPPPPGQIGFAYQGGDFVFMRTEGAMEKTLKAVKNSPYSAQSMTEFTQTLADGNRIHRTTNGSIARDSEGRTRRQKTLPGLGAMASTGEPMKSVMISDPVAGTSYSLEPHSHAAHVTRSTTYNTTYVTTNNGVTEK